MIQQWQRQAVISARISGRIVNDTTIGTPIIKAVSLSSIPINGGTLLSLYGTNLYHTDPTLTILIGSTPCFITGSADLTAAVNTGPQPSGVVCLTGDGRVNIDPDTGVFQRPGPVTIYVMRRTSAATAGAGFTVPRSNRVLLAYGESQQLCTAEGSIKAQDGQCRCSEDYVTDPDNNKLCMPLSHYICTLHVSIGV